MWAYICAGQTESNKDFGLSVYNYAHIGNFRAYVFGDLLKRHLEYKGYRVKHAMNLTDVDDKTISGAQKEGLKLNDFTERYEKYFFEDVKTLNIEAADIYPRATEHVNEMVATVKKLLRKKIAYKTADGIYYSIQKFKGYGKLAHLEKAQLKPGARVKKDEYDKESAQDFALWKYWDKNDGDVYWETELGKKGRPGWHIECSAMSTKYLGQPFDIHTGGVDLIFPHHENEIAQSEGAEGKKFVNCWMHCEHLIVDGKKMSKSLGNFYTLRDVLGKGYNPAAIRYLLLATHYRQQLNFTFEGLKAATAAVEGLIDFVRRLKEVKAEARRKNATGINRAIQKSLQDFEKAMDDDLNISEALASVFELVKQTNRLLAENKLGKKEAEEVIKAMERFDKALGVMGYDDERLDKDAEELIRKREEARKRKDWKEADRIREALRKKGIILEDTAASTRWRKAL